MSLLEVHNLSRRFDSLRAVTSISLAVQTGELRALIGPNGAGKTTFFNLISGVYPPTAGTILFDGQDITALPPHKRVAMGIARTFQITQIFPELSVRENLRIPVEVATGLRLNKWLSRRDGSEVHTQVESLLAMGGLSVKADHLVGELPQGDQRATEIMMALALKPRLLLLDEPTAGMGDRETHEITRLIRQLHKTQGFTILLIEHDMRVIFHLADRITVLAEGSVLAEGRPEDIGSNELVQAAYLGMAA